MNILRNQQNLKLILDQETSFKTDAGWQENMEELEKERLTQIINPIENYETMRYIHEKYDMPSNSDLTQNDIWFYFYFYNITGNTYNDGLDYNLVGIDYNENSKMLAQSTESFFRLEFYKTPNNDLPDRSNRRLVFSRNLSLPLGEKYYYTTINKYIHVPVFMGSNYRNKENMYLFWFQDESAFNETTITGNTFWMTARFFNAKDGTIANFTNTGLTSSHEVLEYRDVYYKMEINKTGVPGRTDYSYIIYRFDGTQGERIGTSNDPIKFYEMIT